MANQAATAIENARSYEAIEALNRAKAARRAKDEGARIGTEAQEAV